MAYHPNPRISSDTLEYVAQIAKDAPLHVQIRESLRRQILTGHYKPGDRIPSEEDLAKGWEVNRLTARRSISDLVNEGLLQRRPGIGTFVIGRRALRDISSLVVELTRNREFVSPQDSQVTLAQYVVGLAISAREVL